MLKRNLDLPGSILLSWFSAGGLLSGGALVTYGLFSESITHYYLLYTVAGLYIIGGCMGILFGGALGMFGRPLKMKALTALKDQASGLLYTIPLSGFLFVVAGWLGLTYWAIMTANILAITFVTIAWLVLALTVALAIRFGWFGLSNLSKRIRKLFTIRLKIEFEE